MYVTESLVPRCPLITGGVIIRCFYQASHSQVTKCFIIPASGERVSGHTVSMAWGVSGLPAGGPARPPKPGDRAGRRQGGAEPPWVPSGTLTGTVGRCCREPGPRPRPPRAELTSVRGVTSSRETPMPIVSLPARFPGLGQEPAQKLDREVAGAHWRRGESRGLYWPGRPRPGFLQAPVARPSGGQVKAQTERRLDGDMEHRCALAWSCAHGPRLASPGEVGRAVRTDRAREEMVSPAPGPDLCSCSSVSRLWGVRGGAGTALFRGRPRQAASAWAALVSPGVTKVVCRLAGSSYLIKKTV